MKTTLTIIAVIISLACNSSGIAAQQTGQPESAVRSVIGDQVVQPPVVAPGHSIEAATAHPQHGVIVESFGTPMANTIVGDACAPAPIIYDCDRQQSSCQRCRVRVRRPLRQSGCSSCQSGCSPVACPSCDEEICRLELDKSEVTKTCFQVEQVPVCIPPVRFPWQKCCPPGTSKTRLVTKLKVKKYKCPNCAYKWKVEEPTLAKTEPEVAPTEPESKLEPAPVEVNEDEVPEAPEIKGAFRLMRRR